MGDWADLASRGHTRVCPEECGFKVEHIDPDVANGIIRNHVDRKHKEG